MSYLLDTMAVIMWWANSPELGRNARRVLEGDERVFASVVNIWEIANKNRIGKLSVFDGFAERLPVLIEQDDFGMLDIRADHALRAAYLPGPHRDPFDRLLAGQALVDGLTLVTGDTKIAGFGCKVLW